jgi:hypothetical protein
MLATAFMLVPYLAYISILEIQATFSSETPAGFRRTKRRYIPEDRNFHSFLIERLLDDYQEKNTRYILNKILTSTKSTVKLARSFMADS